MKKYRQKFNTLIRRLNYSQIQLAPTPYRKLMLFFPETLPKVYEQLEPLGWDMTDKNTFSENLFISHIINWYGKRVAIFLTDSANDYRLAKSVLNSKEFRQLREEINVDIHVNILIHPVIFMVAEDLDTLYCSFDWDKGYTNIDFSHFDENDDLDEGFISEWRWLEATENDQEWSDFQQQYITKLK